MASLFLRALAAVGLDFVAPCSVRFLNFRPVHLLDLTPRALRRLVKMSTAQQTYHVGVRSSRKDFKPGPSGVLDFDVTCQSSTPLYPRPWNRKSFDVDWNMLAGPMTAAFTTADRLYKAGKVASPQCRFCQQETEDIWHLVESCPEVCKQIGKPINAFPDQPNFHKFSGSWNS